MILPSFHSNVLPVKMERLLSKLIRCDQKLMSHPKGGEGAFNCVVTALSIVLAVL